MTTRSQPPSADFIKRREAGKDKINSLDRNVVHSEPERTNFFTSVYEQAGDDPAFVPWADLKEKDKLSQWLINNSGFNLSAIDVACGLGDNAEALANAGYKTTAFDVSEKAIIWAKHRFPNTKVDYQVGNLFDLRQKWLSAFDLVFECYTLQALPEEKLEEVASAIASLVKPGGKLLVYTRVREDGSKLDGPPWPLQKSKTELFANLGFEKVLEDCFDLEKNNRLIPHHFTQWRKNTVANSA